MLDCWKKGIYHALQSYSTHLHQADEPIVYMLQVCIKSIEVDRRKEMADNGKKE